MLIIDILLNKYAKLVVKIGVNIQKNQTLVISSPVECAFFARLIAETAYKEGAREVVMNWKDELSSRIKYLYAPDEIFDEFPHWQKEFYIHYANMGAAFVSIHASDPEVMKGINPERISRANKTSLSALRPYSERLMSNKNTWCVISVPTVSWAKKVFPNESEDRAVSLLWNAIIKSVRGDAEDPVTEWQKHIKTIKRNIDYLNNLNLKSLHFKNSLGTDLTIELPRGHIWLGGSESSTEGVEFIANMPTEEIFTVPLKDGVNGTAVSSMPLNYNGNLIEQFSITFKEGRITDYSAKTGYESLKQLIETDEGSHYLGEVALVPYSSPISDMRILFYNTLFDENASCHLAIGKAYPMCIKGSDSMTKDELAAAGANDSLIHEDFMIGTSDLEISGTTHSGNRVSIFRNGNFTV